MTNVGEETIMGNHSVGELPITSRGLSVFVGSEEVFINEGRWKNAEGEFETLEEAVRNALPRWGVNIAP